MLPLAQNYKFRPLALEDIDAVSRLIARAMNPSEGEYAKRSLTCHFKCREHGIDDGRTLVLLTINEKIIGITGLHFYDWGPPENVWLSWFAVDPDFHGNGLGRMLMHKALELAAQKGFKKLFIETYSSEEFAKARRFYSKFDFLKLGTIARYLPDGSSMVIFCRRVSELD